MVGLLFCTRLDRMGQNEFRMVKVPSRRPTPHFPNKPMLKEKMVSRSGPRPSADVRT